MKASDTVRLKSDPSRVGTLTGEDQIRGGKRRLEVRFDDNGYQFCLEDALELVLRDGNNPYTLFRQGRYGHLRDLRGALTYYRLSDKLANLISSMDTTNTEFLPPHPRRAPFLDLGITQTAMTALSVKLQLMGHQIETNFLSLQRSALF